MNLSIPGYRLTQEVHRSSRSVIYKAVRERDDLAVMLKTIPHEHPEPQDLARLRREHRILSSLDLRGVVRAHALERWENNLALILAVPEGLPLAHQLGPQERMPIGAFFRLALAAVRVLGQVHQHAIHKNLNPHTILWNPRTQDLQLVDFSLASEIGRERQEPNTANWLLDSLPYVSPEQTGRMNRDVDFRTDFYSLGVTFYRLLTGQLPFTAHDPMEWVYSHITQLPEPPHQRLPEIPRALGELVLKLLAKDPEDRYQSAQGLLRDLAECQRRWLETGEIEPFELGRADAMVQFHIPQRLYGREKESQALVAAIEAAALGETTMAVVYGPSGIGKSALVNNACKALVDHNGRFCEGKFDPFERHLPYAALSQALNGLVRQVMSESNRLNHWRTELLERLGPNGRIAVDLVPELARLIGEPPPIGPLNPSEEKNRFLVTIESLLSVFARPEHPLVIFLDDLQWSNASALQLLRSLCTASTGGALLLIGTFRDEEIPDELPLAETLAAIEASRRLHRVPLAPLGEEALNRLVADAFHSGSERTQALSALIHRKCGGNPFFAGVLLRTLNEDGLCRFDHGAGVWDWDLERIRDAELSDDIVNLMVERIQRLAPATREQLCRAACVGNAFELGVLAKLAEQPATAVFAAIGPAILAGLVVPLNADPQALAGQEEDDLFGDMRCQFVHDRVRQTAHALLSEAEREALHLRIGRLLLAGASETERVARASEIAQQLNAGRALITEEAEREVLLALNLEAGRKAMKAIAYRTAFDFLSVARELLPPRAWSERYEPTFEVFKLQAACAYQCGEWAIADACYAELNVQARTPFEQAEVYALKAVHYTCTNHLGLAIEEGVKALERLGIRLSAQPSQAVVLAELLRAKLAQGRRKGSDLDAAPVLGDRDIQLAMKVLGDFLVPAYLTGNQTLFAATVLKQATLSLRHGHSIESSSAYASYAVLLAGLGDLRGARDFGQLSLRLAERIGNESKCRTLVLYALFSHRWNAPWSTLCAWLKEAIEVGRQAGDFVFMAYASGYVHLWDPQLDLKTALEERRKYLALCKQAGYENALDVAMLSQQLWLNWREETDGPLSLSDAHFDEAACLARLQQARNVSGIAIYHLCKLQAACFNEAWAEAWQQVVDGDKVVAALAGSPYVVEYAVHGFWAAVAIAQGQGPEARAAKRRARRFQRQMRAWARHCPDNFQHHALLMDAELAWLSGRFVEAAKRFDEAIASARCGGFVRYEALANERAGRFYQAWGLSKVSLAYLTDAREGYRRWGALAKVRALDLGAHPRLAPEEEGLLDGALHGFNLGQVPQLVESGMLDLGTIWKATQAISGEANFEGLLERLLLIVKKSAGAQRAVLVLQEGDDGEEPAFLVQAESPESGEVRLRQAEPLDGHEGVPVGLIRHVIQHQACVVLHDAAREGDFTRDPYVRARRPQSVLGVPIVNQGNLLGVLYLENNLVRAAFTPERLSVLQILAGQAAISLQNIRSTELATYMEAERTIREVHARELEARVEERTAELKQAYEQLKELDHLKTNFLGVVSHELRTPLTTIRGYAEFLDDRTGGELTEDQADYVQQIHHGALQLHRLVDDLLDFARVEAGTFKLELLPTELVGMVAEALDNLAPLLQEHEIHLDTHLPEAPVWGKVDGGRVAQVLHNLVGNAVKFTPRGGRIDVALKPTPEELLIEVADSGIGIEAEHLPRLFQKFYQVDSSSTRQQGGVGLGLSIAQTIVEAHGGTIGVDSRPGQGSTFWFTLPLRSALEAPSGRPSVGIGHR